MIVLGAPDESALLEIAAVYCRRVAGVRHLVLPRPDRQRRVAVVALVVGVAALGASLATFLAAVSGVDEPAPVMDLVLAVDVGLAVADCRASRTAGAAGDRVAEAGGA